MKPSERIEDIVRKEEEENPESPGLMLSNIPGRYSAILKYLDEEWERRSEIDAKMIEYLGKPIDYSKFKPL